MGCFWFLEAKEVIEATEVFRTTQIPKIDNEVARITLFRCFEKRFFFWLDSWNFSEILPSLRTEAVEDKDVNFNQIKGSQIKIPLLRIPKQSSN